MGASKEAANNNIPGPNSGVTTLVAKFQNVGLTLNDMVALSGRLSSFLKFGMIVALSFSVSPLLG